MSPTAFVMTTAATTYKSKINVTLLIFVTLCLVVLPVLPLLADTATASEIWFIVIYCPLAIAFEAYIYTSTHYTISGDTLTVKSLLLCEKIKINDITLIKHTHTWLSAPALSLNRIELRYKQNRTIVISPRDESRFIAQLHTVNPTIEIH